MTEQGFDLFYIIFNKNSCMIENINLNYNFYMY